jgi:N-acetylgalactosamine-N,N'-diacetylbacillosaminyl-diphospho-undecaprenol 4-alpha-N-acetylgalactosaminyltransferase
MKILFLINEFGTGGAERVVSYLLKYLPEFDPKIKLYLYLLEDEEKTYLIPPNVEIITGSKNPGSNFVKFLKLPLLAIHLKEFSKKNKIDIVISLLNRANYVNVLSRYFGSRHKCILSERNTASLIYDVNRMMGKINRLLIRHLYPISDRIIAISEGVKKDLEQNFNISPKKIEVIYNPLDIEGVIKKSTEKIKHEWLDNKLHKTIITVGRLDIQKNQALLIRAFKHVNEKLPETRLLILGEGHERDNLNILIKNLEIDSKVQMLGLQKNPFSFLSRADLFVLSSDFEGFGNVIIEAMACGCPVISTDCQSGPSEIITDEKNGILVTVGDADLLSKTILSLLQNSKLRKKLVLNAHNRVGEFNMNKIIHQYYLTIVGDA